MTEDQISLVIPEDGKPLDKIIISRFEHGRPNRALFGSVHPKYRHTESTGKTEGIMTLPAKAKLSYVGRALKQGKHPGCRYYIGCRNNRTGKMTIHDAEILHMKPTFEDLKAVSGIMKLRGMKAIADAKPEQVFDGNLSYREKMDRLTAAFGSSKKKRAVTDRQKFKTLMGSGAAEAVNKAMDQALSQFDQSMDTPDGSASANSILPPCNKTADHPEDVYTINDLIGSQVQVALKSAAETFFKRTREELSDWTDVNEYPWYILEQLKVLPVDEGQRWDKAISLTYLHCLITLFKFKPHDFRKTNCLPVSWPQYVKSDLLRQFTLKSKTGEGQKPVIYFPARLKDKLLLHILALTLAMEGGRLDPTILIRDLGLPERKINQFYRSLGCAVSAGKAAIKKKEDGKPTITLTLPLKLADETKPARGGKKRNLMY